MRTNQADKMLGVDRITRKPRRISLTLDGVIGLTFVLLLAVLLLYVVGTAVSFGPKAAEYRTWYSEIQAEIDQLAAEQSELAAEVDAWPGVTEITAETIPPLADPAETTMLVPAVSIERLGTFKVYAYYKGPNGLLTATGTICEEGRTVAADFGVLPAGTKIYIEGVGERIVEDTGVSGRDLDLFIASKDECIQWGIQEREVWVIEEVVP